MHISDGIISTPVCIAANAVAVALIYVTGNKARHEEIPRMGMTGAALFVASLIHFPVAGTSLHLGLFGIAGILLGKRVFPVVFTALLFQSLIFQHGGLLTVGVNALNMGAGAYAAWLLWRIRPLSWALRAALAGIAGILIPAVMMVSEFKMSGYGSGIYYLLLIYIVAAVVEGGIALFAVSFFRKVKPEILTSN